jgi:lipopolysaccharide transport system ATP-binding protein
VRVEVSEIAKKSLITPTDVEPVICVENVRKRFYYKNERPSTLLEQLTAIITPRQKRAVTYKELWAVDDVSLNVMPSQVWGIIGRNGSGKSTLLKLIARILRPNEGRITVRGRVSVLLELGAGFHPDLTGRENIFLNAAVLGLKKKEIEQHYDSVVAFSELGEFIDMPVKHYSSGMYMRLGFSVAIHVNPDILIVDEILAVGDQTFQEKCFERIHDMKQRGVNIVMVSHNMEVMRRLCTHVLWLEQGKVRAFGQTEQVISQYLDSLYQVEPRQMELGAPSFTRWGTGDIELTAVRILNEAGEPQNTFRTGDALILEMSYQCHRPVTEPEFGLAIYRRDSFQINGPNNQLAGLQMGVVSGSGTVRYQIADLCLLPGSYLVTAAIHDSRRARAFDYHEKAYEFQVVAGGTHEVYGLVAFPAIWTWSQNNDTVETAVLSTVETS